MLYVYDASNGICLFFNKSIDTKTNEILVAQEILRSVQLKDCIVTFDALNNQKMTIQTIAEKKMIM